MVAGRSRVIRVTDPSATDGAGRDNLNLDDSAVKRMVDKAVQAFVRAPSVIDAWKEIIPDASVRVAIKINCQITGVYTKARVVTPVIDGLMERGVASSSILVYDLGDAAFTLAGFKKNLGAGVKIGTVAEFGGFSWTDWYGNPLFGPFSRFCRVLAWKGEYGCDYLINVPVIKALDGYSGVSMSMKNHFGSISGPASLHEDIHDNIAALNAHDLIRKKTRLILVDGIFAEYKWVNGRDQRYVSVSNQILAGIDPVAIDTVGWRTIEALRKDNGLDPVKPQPEYLWKADQRYGLGNSDLGHIDIVDL